MLDKPCHMDAVVGLGIGYYTAPEAARLLKVPARDINRWLRGDSYLRKGRSVVIPPLWTPQLPANKNRIELGFRDLVDLRFVSAFMKAGLGLKTIRNCLESASRIVNDDHPFSTRRFQTEGRTIFLDSIKDSGESETIDLKQHQYVIKQVIERSFKDLDIEDDAVVRWRPYKGRESIVVDPERAFGQPVTASNGVPTIALADAVKTEGSVERAARIYEVPVAIVRDAVNFENDLMAA